MQVQKKPAPKKKKLASKKKGNPDINPITKPYAKKKAGYVTGAAMHIDNIRPSRRVRKKRVMHNVASF